MTLNCKIICTDASKTISVSVSDWTGSFVLSVEKRYHHNSTQTNKQKIDPEYGVMGMVFG